ncbi:hook microtubule tethering protein [Haematobia irritans]|uniref:hook microtubule tethering protein n=1 Tax=Haematobia irritans TaxID=7368 RepID=UPI003F4F9F60
MGDMCQSLIDWFQTLKLSAPHSNAEELSDGVALAQALHQFSPETFTAVWLSKIKADVGVNWRLKMSNLKKVVEALYDYYTDVLNYSLAEFPRPDTMRIAEKHDATELERLLQLILGCAVNCATKQDYIRDIMLLEESLQANIMKALQDLESSCQGASMSRNPLSIVNFDSKILQEERDRLAQKCFDLEKKNVLLVEEKANLTAEVAKLQEDIRKLETASTIGDDGVSLGPVMAGSTRYLDMRKQLDELKEELMQSETSREDLRLKSQQQETEIQVLQQRIEELNKTATEFLKLKDEIDVLRETNEKLKVCETQVKTYKKKLEDYTDLKKQLKLLDERSAEYLQQNVQFEEDAKKCATLRGQIEQYKKEVQDLHMKLDKEMSNNLKLEFESKTMEETIFSLQQAKEGLAKERDNLREALDELKCGQLSNSSEDVATAMSKELQPTAITERLRRLELENKALREGQGGQTALMQLLDDANKRNTNLREQLKAATERIMSLTHAASANDDGTTKATDISKQMKHFVDLNEQKAMQLDEYISQTAALQGKITQLETTLATREQELLSLDTKYRKCVERAKDIIKNMDPRGINASEATLLENMQEIADYKKQEFSSLEENLMATAFYRLSANSQRDIIDSKLAMLLGPGQTFLSRQRQSGPRKAMAAVKGK